jgi:ribA/ribD-fused uncharacterized protein
MERALEKTRQGSDILELISIRNQQRYTEFEVKLLTGRIQTRDVAERILKVVKDLAIRTSEEHRAVYVFPDNLRVNIVGISNIHKLCQTKSFKGIPVVVERKTRYFDSIDRSEGEIETKLDVGKDTLDVPDFFSRFTLRTEKPLKTDYAGDVDDARAHIRILHRQSFYLPGNELRVDFSMVKARVDKQSLREVLKNTASYELEIEYIPREEPRKSSEVRRSLYQVLEKLIGAYQESHHILPLSDLQRYSQEFRLSGNIFYNPVTLERGQSSKYRPFNILSGYTVTNKADGERCGIYVCRDRRVIRVTPAGIVTYTGLTALDDTHVEDFLDGEYIASKNLFCIFDVYKYKGRDTKVLPLFTTDEDIQKYPLSSRLGCGRLFVQDISKDFSAESGEIIRIETKMFLAGDGAAMEEAIQKILDTEFEYEIDGLIFTPRSSPVAPPTDVKGRRWIRVYKWKPPHQNSIDFLVRIEPTPGYDTQLKQVVRRGTLYVGRSPGEDFIYPCETLTGEYVPPKLPLDMSLSGTYVPSVFQPSAPRDTDAYIIKLRLNDRDIPVDEKGNKIEDNTIIECSYDVEKQLWNVMRTRYDKTYEYKVLGKAQYGNDIKTAESVWTSIHVPITEQMIRQVYTSPIDDTYEDDMYYRDDLDSRDRILRAVYSYHNRVKESQYQTYVIAGNTIMDLACGRAGDLYKWMNARASKVLGLDIAETNLTGPRQGACVRYLKEKASGKPFLPKVLFATADMTKRFEEQDSKYLRIVFFDEPATTPYLSQFKDIQDWDCVTCQFAIHYACESEDVFRAFVHNLKHCKSIFFGTCLDGKSVYTLLAGKDRHTFRERGKIFAEITKKYTDDGEWKEEFGQQIDVLLETIVKPTPEYLVPFEKITEILRESGFELIESKSFGDIYAAQSKYTFGRSEQDFSFLYKTFAFRRVGLPENKQEAPEISVEEEIKEAETKETETETETTETETETETKETETKETETEKPKPVRRKRIVKTPAPAEPLPEILYFFSKEPENLEFSNFYETTFKLDDVEYKSAEHAYQSIKAKTFGDEEMFAKILKAKSAQSAKSFGKKVKDYKEDIWSAKKEEVMKTILRAKFTQNLELRKKLIDTGDKILANADARDKFWGIGTSATTTIAKDPKKWKGENKLGKILMEVRGELRAE